MTRTTHPPLVPALLIALCAFIAGCAAPLANEHSISSGDQNALLVPIVSGLEHPWSIAFLENDTFLVTERPGRMRIIENKSLSEPLEGLPRISAGGQGGLLDVALHPSFEENQLIYFTYSTEGDDGTTTALARARLTDRLEDVEVVFTAQPSIRSQRHYGSRIAISEHHIYASIGDRGSRDEAQSLQSHAGTIIRLNLDGSVPSDNPFLDDADALDEIYAYGVRNAQGLIWREDRDELWAHEHGPRGGDEINIIRAGANYGWPLFTYGQEYIGGSIGLEERPEGIEAAIHHWTPSIAPSGMVHYRGEALEGWSSNLFIGALAGEHLARLELDGTRVTGEERLLEGTIGRIRDVREGPDGNLYLLTDERNGALYRLEPLGR